MILNQGFQRSKDMIKRICMRARLAIGLTLLMLNPIAAFAQEGETSTLYNVFSLSASASADVDNDWMTATLAVQAEDKDAAALANKVNATMSWAVNKLRPFATLETKTRDYQTYPRYDTSQSRRLIGWRATQTLEITTDDFKSAGKAIQELQERLQVQGIRLSAKTESRKVASDRLINQALDAFKQRARLIQTNMGATGYRIVDVNIHADNNPRHFNNYEAADMMRSRVAEAPAIEAGSSQVTVQVSGRIQLD